MVLTPPKLLALLVMVRGKGWNANDPIMSVTVITVSVTLNQWS
jgi:hypothetical protein